MTVTRAGRSELSSDQRRRYGQAGGRPGGGTVDAFPYRGPGATSPEGTGAWWCDRMVGGGEATMPEQSAPAATASAVAAADDAFGGDLYRLLSEQAPDTVFSPVSVASVLQMALCGARGQTAAELAGALHLDGSPQLDGSLHLDGSADTAAGALKALAALV